MINIFRGYLDIQGDIDERDIYEIYKKNLGVFILKFLICFSDNKKTINIKLGNISI